MYEGSLLINICAELRRQKYIMSRGLWSFNGFRNRPHIEFNCKSRFLANSLTIRSPRDIQGISDWLKHSDPFLGR